ncbi:hypothetical protein N7517_000475 [Penicillium concentricum]|uniref:Uncharacterized protein n=1 Tax=Penicillium concentricum TaxID=293559 RepID=A0A9W9SS85_9EURO|nr:uncharacterized protein N7517_000475 [Penicillium concentricum]KAJ5382564.1 hypothetical protein N7517_000475 [Penicillium concentricum]
MSSSNNTSSFAEPRPSEPLSILAGETNFATWSTAPKCSKCLGSWHFQDLYRKTGSASSQESLNYQVDLQVSPSFVVTSR